MASRWEREPKSSNSQFLNDDFHRGLARWNRHRLAARFPVDSWQQGLDHDVRMLRLETGFLEELRAGIRDHP